MKEHNSKNPKLIQKRKRRCHHRSIAFFLMILIIVLNFSNLLSFLLQYSPRSVIAQKFENNTPNLFIKSPLTTENITSNSMELVYGNLIYSDLLQNPEFTTSTSWSFKNSSNITSQWSPTEETAWLYHSSNASADLAFVNITNLAESVNLITYRYLTNDYTYTHVLDGQTFQIEEGGPTDIYNVEVEFDFHSNLSNINYIEINMYGRMINDACTWQIYNFLNNSWELLNTIPSGFPYQWFNASRTQDPLDYEYVNAQGDIQLRVYDNDGFDNQRNWVYFDYIEVKTNGTDGTLKTFDQVASVNQSFTKDFTTAVSPPTQVTLLWEGFESGSFLTNEWDAQPGGGTLDITTTNSYNGSNCAHFAGDSTLTESTLTKTFNMSEFFNASLSFYITVETLEAGEFLCIDIYDGQWYNQVRSYTGDFGYQLETVDLHNYSHIDGFQIQFRGHMSHATGDNVRLDDLTVSALKPGNPTVFLNFSYCVEQKLNVQLDLQVRLWDSTQLLGTLWSAQITSPTNFINQSIDVSNDLTTVSTYNISFEVHARISTLEQVNFSVRYDSITIICQNITDSPALYYISNNKDDRILDFVPLTQGLDIRFNFSVLEGNMSIHVYYQARMPITLWIYNFSSSSWVNLTNLQTLTFDWMNLTDLENFDFVEDDTHTLILRYTNCSDLLIDEFLIDYHSITVRTYSSTLAHVQTNPSEVQPGQIIITQVNFTALSLNRQIKGATIFTNYTEDQYLFQELPNGLYNVTFYTDLSTPGQKIIEIIAVREGFDNGTITTAFNLTGFPSELRFISGVILINGTHWADPAPFPNDQTKEIQVYLNGSFGGLDGAIIQARLNITGQLMPYEDLGNTIGHTFDGYYNITLDTSSLHNSQIGRIDIIAGSVGYSAAHLNFTFQVVKIPSSYLLLETDIENLTVYEGDSIRIGASLKDLFHDKVLFSNPSEGNLTWRINSTGASDFHQMEKLLTVYIADIVLPQYNISAGTYNLTIETRASIDYENVSKDIRLEILPKEKTKLEIFNIPAEILSGESLTITAKLYYADMPDLPLKEATIKFTIGAVERFAITDNNGIAEITYIMPEGDGLLTITASYEGAASIASANDTITIHVITIGTIIWRYSPVWLPILLILAVILLIRLNKRIIRLTKFQKEIRIVQDKIFKRMRIGKVPQPTREALLTELFNEQIPNFKVKNRKN